MNNSVLQGKLLLNVLRTFLLCASLSSEICCRLTRHRGTWSVPCDLGSSDTEAWGVWGVIMDTLHTHTHIFHSCETRSDVNVRYWVHIQWVNLCSHQSVSLNCVSRTWVRHSWDTRTHRWDVTCWLNKGQDAHHSASSKEWSCMTCTFTEACSLTFLLLMNESQPRCQRWPYAVWCVPLTGVLSSAPRLQMFKTISQKIGIKWLLFISAQIQLWFQWNKMCIFIKD